MLNPTGNPYPRYPRSTHTPTLQKPVPFYKGRVFGGLGYGLGSATPGLPLSFSSWYSHGVSKVSVRDTEGVKQVEQW